MAQALSIQILEPYGLAGNKRKMSLLVTLDCGCPACGGGRCDASRFRIRASIFDSKERVADLNFDYSGRPGEFTAVLPHLTKGEYDLFIEALVPESGFAGRLSTKVMLG